MITYTATALSTADEGFETFYEGDDHDAAVAALVAVAPETAAIDLDAPVTDLEPTAGMRYTRAAVVVGPVTYSLTRVYRG